MEDAKRKDERMPFSVSEVGAIAAAAVARNSKRVEKKKLLHVYHRDIQPVAGADAEALAQLVLVNQARARKHLKASCEELFVATITCPEVKDVADYREWSIRSEEWNDQCMAAFGAGGVWEQLVQAPTVQEQLEASWEVVATYFYTFVREKVWRQTGDLVEAKRQANLDDFNNYDWKRTAVLDNPDAVMHELHAQLRVGAEKFTRVFGMPCAGVVAVDAICRSSAKSRPAIGHVLTKELGTGRAQVVVALGTMAEDKRVFVEFCDRVIQFERKEGKQQPKDKSKPDWKQKKQEKKEAQRAREIKTKPATETEVAAAATGAPQREGRPTGFRYTCFRCGVRGHRRNDPECSGACGYCHSKEHDMGFHDREEMLALARQAFLAKGKQGAGPNSNSNSVAGDGKDGKG